VNEVIKIMELVA